jgi:2,4-dienoyl-CoA reductase-like NADH-dependent reductase (Old Yellow Enzyme family)
MAESELFAPFQLGPLVMPNRIVMAPMTRNRAGAGNVPTALNAEYYRQRASAGLIVTEASQVSPFLANPDLPTRLAQNAPLNAPDPATSTAATIAATPTTRPSTRRSPRKRRALHQGTLGRKRCRSLQAGLRW